MDKFMKSFMIVSLIALIGNIIFSLFYKNLPAFFGWLVASLWFPYDKVFGSESKSKVKVDNEK